ncbi:MAG: tRNA (N6-threonylcarbamoyladenosine(37)-N6)-methyltransferase TrmO [Fimbriimonas sp.]|nr:tRNA (N6-threonylcarbamoyladenosine(37)-N6)-methyltransferase TrmO [Fimbriimonas sp.]
MSEFRSARIEMEPIGFVRCEKNLKFDARHQPDDRSKEVNRVELLPERRFELALNDLDGFERIWIVSWFDRNTSWRPRVLPPRGPAIRRGVFATRSPHRPNPIGLTCVRLLDVSGLTLTVGPIDLVDGTPVLDIKPYLATVDAFPGSGSGWVQDVETELASGPSYKIEESELASRQLIWLRDDWNVDFTERAYTLLAIDPSPHRTRRILCLGENAFRMACGPWRLFFHLDGSRVVIDRVGKGYSDESLSAPGWEKIPNRDAQVAFSLMSF